MDGDKIKELSKGSINIFPFFKNNEGEEFGIADILKDSSFGGRGKGSGTAVEDHNLKLLNNEIIKAMEENDNKPITVVFNGESYENITGVVLQAGFPKADFYLINSGGHPQMFISHKKAGAKGPAANDFIRWSGYIMYADNPEVKEFNNALESFLVENDLDGLPNKTRFISPIKDKELIRKLIYGPKYGEKTGPDNVDVIFQGKIFLTQKSPGTYEISSEHTEIPPSIPEGEYYPYMTSSYRGDRMMFGIKNNEAIVMTKSVSYSVTILQPPRPQGTCSLIALLNASLESFLRASVRYILSANSAISSGVPSIGWKSACTGLEVRSPMIFRPDFLS